MRAPLSSMLSQEPIRDLLKPETQFHTHTRLFLPPPVIPDAPQHVNDAVLIRDLATGTRLQGAALIVQPRSTPRHQKAPIQIDILRRISHEGCGPLLPTEEHLSGRVGT